MKFEFSRYFRYCVNSSSLDFVAETEVDGTIKREESAMIHHPATMGGCGADGICRLPNRKSQSPGVQDRIVQSPPATSTIR